MLVQIRRLFLLVLAGCARLPALPPFPLGRVVARVLLQVPLHPLAQVDLVAGRTPVLQRNGHFALLNLDLLLLLLHRVQRRRKIGQLFRRFRIRQQRRRQWRWRWWRIQRSRRLQPLLLHVLEEVVRVAGRFAQPPRSRHHPRNGRLERLRRGHRGSTFLLHAAVVLNGSLWLAAALFGFAATAVRLQG
uniref:(northern house mosquito) hypothetical protein n=1 Tax=Culex pipiens TaxID=7175 RepID=A0A8D8KVF7_CULPI